MGASRRRELAGIVQVSATMVESAVSQSAGRSRRAGFIRGGGAVGLGIRDRFRRSLAPTNFAEHPCGLF